MGVLYLLCGDGQLFGINTVKKAVKEKAVRKKIKEIATREKEKAALKVTRLHQCGRSLTLADIFFTKHKRTLRSIKIVRNIASFASVSQTFRLLLTCKEMLATEKKIFHGYQLPTVCNMRKGDGLKMYRLMVKTLNSRWLNWLYTSNVKKLKLPIKMTNEEMLIMFGGDGGDGDSDGDSDSDGRFSKLQSLNLGNCIYITDAIVSKVARRCSNLQLLNLGCFAESKITDVSLLEVANGCSNLLLLNLSHCENITDASLIEIGRRCSKLQLLDLRGCMNITDASVSAVAQGCPNLQSLDLGGCCWNITDVSLMEVARRCSNLQTLHLVGCSITDASVMEVARRCSNLQTLYLENCSNITDASLLEIGRRCLNLQCLDLGGCINITDASVLEVARGCSNLQALNLDGCRNITDASLREVANLHNFLHPREHHLRRAPFSHMNDMDCHTYNVDAINNK